MAVGCGLRLRFSFAVMQLVKALLPSSIAPAHSSEQCDISPILGEWSATRKLSSDDAAKSRDVG